MPLYTLQVDEKDIKAVWRLLAGRNPEIEATEATPEVAWTRAKEREVAAEGEATAAATEETAEGEDTASEWPEQTLEKYYGKCKPVHRAILDCVAEAGVKGRAIDVEKDVYAAAKAVWDDENEGEGTFTRHTLTGQFTWLTKYSGMVSNGEWPFKHFTKAKVWYFLMDPATAKTILRLKKEFEIKD